MPVILASSSHKVSQRAHDLKRRACERTGPSRDHFGGACQIHTSPLHQKVATTQKKVLKLGIQKVIFLYIELNEIGQNFTKIIKFLYS